MSDEGGRADNEAPKIGYRNTPRHTRFKPGQSGNPRGRPRTRRTLADVVEHTMAMPVPVTVKGRRKTVPTITALVWRLREKALGGDLRSLQMLISLILPQQGEDEGGANLSALLAEDLAILRDAGLIERLGHKHGGEDDDGDA
jgi:hypothetical protein